MDATSEQVGLLGFGEAGAAFAAAGRAIGLWPRLAVHDRLMVRPDGGPDKRRQILALGAVTACDTTAECVRDADLVLSLVTADQALAAAEAAAAAIRPDALYLDFNSVAPDTKAQAARVIEAAGADYVDVAVMSPVLPARLAAPLLLSGGRAADAADALSRLGFATTRVTGQVVGRASSIKMIRSVMIKGIEALCAECVLAATQAGVLDEVIASLDASWPGADWAVRADYNLDRMLAHGLRRAAEMQEVVRTLDSLGVGGVMSRAAADRQRAIGALDVSTPPEGLSAKVERILRPTSASPQPETDHDPGH